MNALPDTIIWSSLTRKFGGLQQSLSNTYHGNKFPETNEIHNFTCSVQIPFGPRKSGMPHEVDIPAPVNTTRCLLCMRNRWKKKKGKNLENLVRNVCTSSDRSASY